MKTYRFRGFSLILFGSKKFGSKRRRSTGVGKAKSRSSISAGPLSKARQKNLDKTGFMRMPWEV
ncbi:MAG: hypothetical protein D3908_01605 [Candidatus Electrothrix sp. AUS4]|nr:hypothetical protein [Candidatus Electrothrix sp. AUS4]